MFLFLLITVVITCISIKLLLLLLYLYISIYVYAYIHDANASANASLLPDGENGWERRELCRLIAINLSRVFPHRHSCSRQRTNEEIRFFALELTWRGYCYYVRCSFLHTRSSFSGTIIAHFLHSISSSLEPTSVQNSNSKYHARESDISIIPDSRYSIHRLAKAP